MTASGSGAPASKVTGSKRPRRHEEEEDLEVEDTRSTPSKLVKLSNCVDGFNDITLAKMLGKDVAKRIVPDEGITWAVQREGKKELKFAGFGWVEFETFTAAKLAVQFDIMGENAELGRKANGGNDLFVGYHHDEIPNGRCGWCGKDGHYAKECPQRAPGAPIAKRPREDLKPEPVRKSVVSLQVTEAEEKAEEKEEDEEEEEEEVEEEEEEEEEQ